MQGIQIAPEFEVKATAGSSRLVGLWRLLSGFHSTYLWASLSLGIAALAKMSTYLLLRYFVDGLLGDQDLAYGLPTLALGFLGLAVLEGGFTFLSGMLAARTAEGIAYRLRTYIYDHIQRMSFSYHDKSNTGDLISRSTSDVDAVRRFFSDQAIGAGRVVLIFAVNLAALFHLHAQLAWVSIIVMPFILVISFLFFRRVTTVYEAYQEQESVLSTTLQENLSGMRVVKAFARQTFEIDKFEKDNWEKFLRGRRFLTLHSLFWPITDILLGAQMLGGFLYAAGLAIDGSISVGTYLAYVGLLIWLIWPMRNLGRLVVQMSTGLVSFGRLQHVVKEVREDLDIGRPIPASQPIRGEIVFDKVSFSYGEDVTAIEDISFRCEAGQTVALLGSTGSGKTTVVNLLPRFYEFSGGSITLDGVDLREYPLRTLRRNIGFVEQEPFLFSRTIRENIAYGVQGEVTQEQVEEAARAAAIHEVILGFSEGYDTLVGERGVTLSGGQKQRIAIARAVLRDPAILILDDATSSVDTETEEQIREALGRLMQGRSTFVIAHRIQSVMQADLILVFDKGRIIQRGRHEELLDQEGPYAEIYDIQARIEIELQKELSLG